MGFFSNLKENWNNAKQEVSRSVSTKKSFVREVTVEVISGQDNIFSKKTSIGLTEDNEIIVNYKHKVTILSCVDNLETDYGKSNSKKLGGAAVGGALFGGAGAVVGALSSGNNKEINKRYDILTVLDENENEHEVKLKKAPMQNIFLNNFIV